MNKKTDEEIVILTLEKLKIRFHYIASNDNPKYTYTQPMKPKDVEGKIHIGYGLVDLKDPGQLNNFFEFHEGELASY